MSAVVYSSSRLLVQQRKRTPLGRFMAWLGGRVADTALQTPLSALVRGSVLLRLAVAILSGLLLGALIDFSTTWLGFGAHAGMMAAVTVSALAGAGGGGGAGAALGVLWLWVIGSISDSIAADHFQTPLEGAVRRFIPLSDSLGVWLRWLVTWSATMVGGWLAGLGVTWAVEHYAWQRPRGRRIVIAITATLLLGAGLIVLGSLFSWLVAHDAFSLGTIREARDTVGRGWLWLGLSVCWLVLAAVGICIATYANIPPFQAFTFDIPQPEPIGTFGYDHWIPTRPKPRVVTWRDCIPLITGYCVLVNLALIASLWAMGFRLTARLFASNGVVWLVVLSGFAVRHWAPNWHPESAFQRSQAEANDYIMASVFMFIVLVIAMKCS